MLADAVDGPFTSDEPKAVQAVECGVDEGHL